MPGSMIAKLWFSQLFPPSRDDADYEAQSNVFANLMVISTSLALGLILGFGIVRACEHGIIKCRKDAQGQRYGMGPGFNVVPW
eukprot:COSAG01_NODE_2238_length_8089_cov_5.948936_5_plen_83_part_00